MQSLAGSVDEPTLTKFYSLSTLEPRKWEQVDAEKDGVFVGAVGAITASSGKGLGRDEDTDLLGLGVRASRNLSLEAQAATHPLSKSFSPSTYLSTLHPDATYNDLREGMSNLRRSLDDRSEEVRLLVREEFDRFVGVRSVVQAVHSEMKSSVINKQTDYGTKQIKETIREASVKAESIYNPVLTNNHKATKLRSTLSVFERNKWFFNLPGTLVDFIESNRPDQALSSYSKAKYLLNTRPQALLSLPTATGGQQPTEDQERAHKRVFDKVWSNIERIMSELRHELLAQLREGGKPVDDVEKTIEILLELESREDPVWTYLDAQHDLIAKQMRAAHATNLANVKLARDRLPADSLSESAMALDLQRCVRGLAKGDSPDSVLRDAPGHEVWQSILDAIKNLSEVVLQSLPGLWRIGKNYMDGKYSRKGSSTASNRTPSQAKHMAQDILKLYATLLSEFFTLTDLAVIRSPPISPGSAASGGSKSEIPPFVPPNANSLSTAWWITRVLDEVREGVTDLNAMDIGTHGAAAGPLKSFVDNVRWRFEEAVCETWARDAKVFYSLEDWSLHREDGARTTYLQLFETFQNYNTAVTYRIAGLEAKGGKSKTLSPRATAEFVNKIKTASLDALYAFLDGLVHLAFTEQTRPGTKHLESPSTRPAVDQDTRILLTVSNLAYLKSTLLPKMTSELEKTLGLDLGPDRLTLDEVVDQLDKIIFDDFVKRRSAAVCAILRSGIIDSGFDWFETPKPTEVRPYMYEALLELVQVHAQISVTARSLVERSLSRIVEEMAREALECFREVKRFGMGGMLRATLEIEFMHQTLLQHVTPLSKSTLTLLYEAVSQNYYRRPAASGSDELQRELDGVKKTLLDSRRSTSVTFACFKQRKRKDADEKVKEKIAKDADAPRPSAPAAAGRI